MSANGKCDITFESLRNHRKATKNRRNLRRPSLHLPHLCATDSAFPCIRQRGLVCRAATAREPLVESIRRTASGSWRHWNANERVCFQRTPFSFAFRSLRFLAAAELGFILIENLRNRVRRIPLHWATSPSESHQAASRAMCRRRRTHCKPATGLHWNHLSQAESKQRNKKQ